MINDNGGTKPSADFSFRVNGGTATPFEADGQNDLTVDAGTYSVTEPAAAGYTTTYDNCDDLALANGATTTCTITNDDQPAKLIVKKIVVNDNGGTKAAADFTFKVNGGTATAFEADGQNDLTVDAGTYTVTEPAAAGYTASYDNCNELALANGATATCTITNDDQPAKLIVKKIVINDNGGTKTRGRLHVQGQRRHRHRRSKPTARTTSPSTPAPTRSPSPQQPATPPATTTATSSRSPTAPPPPARSPTTTSPRS